MEREIKQKVVENQLSLLEVVELLKHLYAKYGRKLQLDAFSAILEKEAPFLLEMIQMLAQHKALNAKALEQLTGLLEKVQKQDKTFVYQSHGKGGLNQIFDLLEKKFGSVEVNYQHLQSDDLSFKVKGQGYLYSRSLSGDVDKLLA